MNFFQQSLHFEECKSYAVALSVLKWLDLELWSLPPCFHHLELIRLDPVWKKLNGTLIDIGCWKESIQIITLSKNERGHLTTIGNIDLYTS